MKADLRTAVVPLFEVRGDHWRGLGTASIIGAFGDSALFITAAHVLERLGHELLTPWLIPNKVEHVFALVGTPEGSLFQAGVTWMTVHAHCDVAVGLLKTVQEGDAFAYKLAIDPAPVALGTPVLCAGYPRMDTEHFVDESGASAVNVGVGFEAREGSVLDRANRHPGLVRWPACQVNVPIDSGMSGGPLLEHRDGAFVVRAVNCSDASDGADLGAGNGARAFCSEIWNALTLPVEFTGVRYQGIEGQSVEVGTLLDFFRLGFVDDRGDTVNRFKVTQLASGETKLDWG